MWTFAKKGSARYSSVTRDCYLGFGPSAASLLQSSFSINVFSVEEYVRTIEEKRTPTALLTRLSPRDRALFWMFWNTYNLELHRDRFREHFGRSIERSFGRELVTARMLGLLQRRGDRYRITRRGAYLFHLVEQLYTDQYIDKVWRASTEAAWPARLQIR